MEKKFLDLAGLTSFKKHLERLFSKRREIHKITTTTVALSDGDFAICDRSAQSMHEDIDISFDDNIEDVIDVFDAHLLLKTGKHMDGLNFNLGHKVLKSDEVKAIGSSGVYLLHIHAINVHEDASIGHVCDEAYITCDKLTI